MAREWPERIEQLMRHAANRLAHGMDEAAADAVMAQKYGAPLATFCKEVASRAGIPEAWNAIRNRAQYMQKPRSGGPKKSAPDYDKEYQKAAGDIAALEARRDSGEWIPSEITEMVRHFLTELMTAHDVEQGIEKLNRYLEEAAK